MQDEHGRILILGGTGEAMKLAAALAARPDLPAILSFAGRTKAPLLPSIPSRIGGFGGVDGLAAYLTAMKTPLVIDATHPFAAQMSQNAAQACARLGVPRLTFTRRPWTPELGDSWIEVADIEAAVDALGEAPAHVFLTVGRLSLGAFKRAPQHSYVARSIDQPEPSELPPHGRVPEAASSVMSLGSAGTEAGAALGFARLLEEFAATHLLLDAAALDQFAEAADRLLNAFAFANRQFDHACSGSSQAECGIASGSTRRAPKHRKSSPPRPSVPGTDRGFLGREPVSGFVEGRGSRHNLVPESGGWLRHWQSWRADGAMKA
jgi:precorrin-6A/cobalt-precorrin-6A reductase